MSDPLWDLLGIPETGDPREIRRAYARRLKERRPDEDAEGFQRLRWAYETALLLASRAQAGEPVRERESEQTDFSLPAEEPSPLQLRLDAASRTDGEPGAAAVFGQLFGQDLGLAGGDELEREVAAWLCRFERPPVGLIELADARFGWSAKDGEGDDLPPRARYLLGRLQGYREVNELLARLKFEPHPVLQAVADWLRGELAASSSGAPSIPSSPRSPA